MSYVGHTSKGTGMRPLREGQRLQASYAVTSEERFSKLSVWADGKGSGSNSDQLIRGGIYDSNRQLVAVTEENQIPHGSEATWYTLRATTPVLLPAGTYTLAVQGGQADGSARIGFMGVYDDFLTDQLGSYSYDSGAGNVSISSGQLVPAGTGLVAFHTNDSAVDAQATLETQTGTTFTGVSGIVLKRLDASNYIGVRYTVGELQIVKVDAGVDSVVENFPLVLGANTTYWLRGRIIGNTITAEHFTDDPGLLTTPDISISETLVGAAATKFGTGVAGTSGVRLQTSDTNWRWGSFMVATQPVGEQSYDPYNDGIANAVVYTNVDAQPAIWALTFVPPAIPEVEVDEYLAALPHSVAQQVLGRHGPLDLPAIAATVGWHGTQVDAEIGAFALVNPNGPLAHLVGRRVQIQVSANADVHLSTVGGLALGVNLAIGAEVAPAGTSVNVLVHASADVTEDITLTRRLFLDLAVAAKGSLNASVIPLGSLSSALEAATTVRVGE